MCKSARQSGELWLSVELECTLGAWGGKDATAGAAQVRTLCAGVAAVCAARRTANEGAAGRALAVALPVEVFLASGALSAVGAAKRNGVHSCFEQVHCDPCTSQIPCSSGAAATTAGQTCPAPSPSVAVGGARCHLAIALDIEPRLRRGADKGRCGGALQAVLQQGRGRAAESSTAGAQRQGMQVHCVWRCLALH